MDFGKKMQELRKKNNLSQEDLAEKVGVARQTISKWELGETSPDLKQANILSEVFNVSIDSLLNDKEVKVSSNKTNNRVVSKIGLFFIDVIVVLLSILLIGLLVTLVIFSVSLLVIAVLLILKLNINNLIPNIPYYNGLAIAISLILLSILSVLGSIYYTKLLKYLFTTYKNYHHSILTGNSTNKKVLLEDTPKLNKLTKIILVSFVIVLTLTIIYCIISSGSISFWHKWNWFK